jgi:hypothetical protein
MPPGQCSLFEVFGLSAALWFGVGRFLKNYSCALLGIAPLGGVNGRWQIPGVCTVKRLGGDMREARHSSGIVIRMGKKCFQSVKMITAPEGLKPW